MKKIIFIVSLLTGVYTMNAQQTKNAIPGEYYLRGVMETASGFKLNPDSTFEFFFSYGALDRSGSGKWKAAGNKIIFNSDAPKGQNFALVKSSSTKDNFTTIKITDSNTIFLSSVYAIVQSAGKREEGLCNKDGMIRLPKITADSITLLFEFAPERPAIFPLNNKPDNYFEFRFEPWVMEVFFKDFSLELEDKGLKGSHPLLKEGIYHFARN